MTKEARIKTELLEEIDKVLQVDGVWQGGRLDTIKWLVAHQHPSSPMTRDPEEALLSLLSKAETAASAALRTTKVMGNDDLAVVRNEVVTKVVSLARTLLSESKRLVRKQPVNRRGIVQGAGSHIDTLCAELSVLEEFAGHKH